MHARRLFIALALCLAGAGAASAQTAPPTRIRGTIEAVDAHTLKVKSRDGETIAITLADPLTVLSLKKVDLASVAPGTFIGTATRAGPGGSRVAIEVLVLPEAARGSGEGHFPWDLEPGSMMTNATITGAVQTSSGREFTLAYKDGKQTVTVPQDVPVVTIAPAERADLKPGASVFLAATRSGDGMFTASRVIVGKDGINPPM